jgi:3'(2'), 5'-bisphosphate nucleotidase
LPAGLSLEREMDTALNLARSAGAAILTYYAEPVRVESKMGVDQKSEPVTVADHVANELIVDGIKHEFPDDGILAEESVDTARRLGKDRVWMIDPLDGTNGFIARDGDFAVQIGLVYKGQAILGVVYQPLPDLLYRAVAGGGTWVERIGFNAERLHVSTKTDISKMRLAASRTHRSPRMDAVVKALGVTEEVRRGSVGVKVGLIVEQQCDLYVHLSSRTKQWDTCAPEVILVEAGGRCSDLFGAPLEYNTVNVQNQNGLVASNGRGHDQVVEILKPLLVGFGRRPV